MCSSAWSPTTRRSRRITSGPDGILAGLKEGKVYVDMSTVSPRASRELAERVDSLGAQMLDAPVSGSIPQAETGTLAIFVGGSESAFATVEPLLHELGQAVTRVGTNGQGLLIKLAVNISLAVQTLAFSEGLLLAERGGIDPRLAAEAMSTSSIGSLMLKARVPLLLDLPEQAWFDVALWRRTSALHVRRLMSSRFRSRRPPSRRRCSPERARRATRIATSPPSTRSSRSQPRREGVMKRTSVGSLSGRCRRPCREAEQRRIRGPQHRRQLAAPHLRQPGLRGRRCRVGAPIRLAR
jgi:NAD binding domain of 6-phosphogluconate dehydrogenase/NAD-binding of NADP-dependent 3-hydroxyisobutyrate dehydrogenase